MKESIKQKEIGLISNDWEVIKYIKILKKLKPMLKEEFKVSKIGIFGSFVRNEQKKDSDVDIIVEFSEPIGLKFFELVELLEEKFKRKVDLVSMDGISPHIKPYIENEVVFV